ncbi:MAG TPA: phosphoribosylformylglycinamidine synthase [Marinilabiliales bacterium]|nr:MAG: phosphoribosylformylglycinamidine synthase [Bacteroidetes bacterium GWD2_40_43]OFX95688.1 MAG: phosphoribosylformylglycinamidine synthase [Bacteroidetes bacterium GWE2_40_63]OFY21237.1 MAG: phosphoribosylformylglycinamidine synthase [Bacteroidetes bacterium GWF2_40_13]OFZ23500.1 MAG: phosphoribosylformylglycinamidine synthase [Bacteroidetes bacterium RIFOXYC2_FULL_40_12]HAM97196.1 phosphoribosylformylglycinamidine synthase [Marinilabiliales bacterium]
MVTFFQSPDGKLIAVKTASPLNESDAQKLVWLFGEAKPLSQSTISGVFVGPRKEMITPWSTNAVEITQNMGIERIERIEEFEKSEAANPEFDPMLQTVYHGLNQEIFTVYHEPEPVIYIDDVAAFNKKEGLALNDDEVTYLNGLSKKLNRKLTDSEVFGFSQVNSEHCRHKIFNGTFVIDGEEKPETLFQLIKKTTNKNRNQVVSAYKDNCAFMQGPVIEQFAPKTQDKPDFFEVTDYESVYSLKAETHNFPTTVEPFNGAATGTGGEIRDRIAGGKGSMPIAGTAVYMTSYSRLEEGREWEQATKARPWLYQTPSQILIKASNGASDFGNKFGQPLICGSVLTFEHFEPYQKFGYDKVIMLAGGVGYGKKKDSQKEKPSVGDKVIVMGGDNYRIGMGGGAVSSVDTGQFANAIELNAVQRSNPEMQKRVANAIRALSEQDINPIVSIHDHGAGGHLNCLSELVEETGGRIEVRKLPIGDPTLSGKEIAGNESQERMGLVMHEKDIDHLRKIAERERAPMYVVGETTGDMQFSFVDEKDGSKPIDLQLFDMFGNPPRTIMEDKSINQKYKEAVYSTNQIHQYLEQVLQLEAVACKDWLTNKVDRSVTGKIAMQQNAGPLHLPLNNCGIVALDYQGVAGVATSIGHAPVSALLNAAKGSRLAVAEALTNIVWAPLRDQMKGVSLSANWMWPCKNPGEDARLYEAVEALSQFCLALEINVPTGKDSLSMTQKYKDGEKVIAPGTVIVSGAAEVTDIRKAVTPVLKPVKDSSLIYIGFSKDELKLGGSSFAQVVSGIGTDCPDIADATYFKEAFNTVQKLIDESLVLAGHDISSGGIITTLLEMAFADNQLGLDVNLSEMGESDPVKVLFAENPGVVLQVNETEKVTKLLKANGIHFINIGGLSDAGELSLSTGKTWFSFDIASLRDVWYRTSFLLDKKQTGFGLAKERYHSYKESPLKFDFKGFTGIAADLKIDLKRRKPSGTKAAIIREKGVNGDREMAYTLYTAGFDVKDVHMTDLITGREDLSDVNLIVFVGGFSNSDVLGSAKGWAGAFLFNEKAKKALDTFYARPDTLSLGICNGCQLAVELGLIHPKHEQKPKMLHNASHKFESGFINVTIQKNHSVMLQNMEGMRLGAWVAHGEGKFQFPYEESKYLIPVKYSYSSYPANPNGSPFDAAGICSEDGRHLAMMPHPERAVFPWQCAWYPEERKKDDITPWVKAFVNAREWIEKMK